MRTSTLITLSAAICTALSLLALVYLPWFMLAAPGYWRGLAPSQLLWFLVPPALGTYGLITSIGLFRHKPWSRFSIQVIASVWILNCLLTILFFPHDNRRDALWIAHVVIILIGISWLVFFNARGTKEAFTPNRRAGA
jgi:hypothetical protein